MQLTHADAIRIISALETDTNIKLSLLRADGLGTTYQFTVDCVQHNLTLMARIDAELSLGALSRTYPNIAETKRLLAERK